MPNKEKILIVVAHSDDETIGLGGTIANHIDDGAKVYCISMTDGVGARDTHTTQDIESRVDCSNQAANILGFEWLSSHKFLDNSLDCVPLLSIIKAIEKIKNDIKPTLVYTHSCADLNIDHRIVTQAVLTVFRPQPGEVCREIRLFEVSSATDYGNRAVTNIFYPNLFVSIGKNWPKKLSALKAYDSEIRDYPHTRSYEGIQNLAKFRGNQVGLDMAEAFEVIRRMIV